jgi:response regulator NasT
MQIETLGSSPHLLLVDDDRLVLSTLSIGLQHAGYRVSTTDSAEEAEALIADGTRPDLALVDVRMAGRDGIHLARSMQEFNHIPFMMLSAYANREFVEQAVNLGALGYLIKPLDLPQLLPAIQAALVRAAEFQGLRHDREKLLGVMDGHRAVNLAVGITMVQHHLSQSEAYNLLRDTARNRRRKLHEIADEIIRASEAINLTAGK